MCTHIESDNRSMRRPAERGVALILVMLAMLVLSVLAATIVFTARAETFASYNFKLDTQADYLAKAGIQRAVNWFRSNRYRAVGAAGAANPITEPNTYYYVTQTDSVFQLWTSGVLTPTYVASSPVTCKSVSGGCPSPDKPVQLIGYGSGSSNYPDINDTESPTAQSVVKAFASDLNDPANTRVTGDASNSGYFNINAVLLNYRTVNVRTDNLGHTPPAWCQDPVTGLPVNGFTPPLCPAPVETWKITSQATWTGPSSADRRVATAEEEVIIQPIYTSTWGNALYGFCSVTLKGSAGTCTDAFNSALGPYGGGNPSVVTGQCDSTTTNVIGDGAGIGSNGGVTLTGGKVTVGGDVTIGTDPSSPSCPTGFSGGSTQVAGQVMYNGPHIDPPPVPTFRTNFPTGAPSYSPGSQTLPIGATWPVIPPPAPPAPYLWPGNEVPAPLAPPYAAGQPCMVNTPPDCTGTAAHPYEINSITMSGSSPVLNLVGGPDALHPVYYDIATLDETQGNINVSGYVVLNVQTTLKIAGNGISNGVASSIPPMAVQINYAGTNTVTLQGNGALCAVVNAPNAEVDLGGGGSGGYMIGSIQADKIVDNGGFPVHYDVSLNQVSGTLGTVVSTAYSRRKM
jgi:Tfp pilus assembly protein PilV